MAVAVVAGAALTMKQPDRYAVELVIFGVLGALVKSKAREQSATR